MRKKTQISNPNTRLLLTLFKLVCNIPYGSVGTHNIDDMLANNKGSCSTKHSLLGFLLKQNQFKVKYMMGKSNLRDLNCYLPGHLKINFDLWDFHNFLLVNTINGELIVDATFGLREKQKGAPSNINWEATQNCQILFPVTHSWKVTNLFNEKQNAIKELTLKEQHERQLYFKRLIDNFEEK